MPLWLKKCVTRSSKLVRSARFAMLRTTSLSISASSAPSRSRTSPSALLMRETLSCRSSNTIRATRRDLPLKSARMRSSTRASLNTRPKCTKFRLDSRIRQRRTNSRGIPSTLRSMSSPSQMLPKSKRESRQKRITMHITSTGTPTWAG